MKLRDALLLGAGMVLGTVIFSLGFMAGHAAGADSRSAADARFTVELPLRSGASSPGFSSSPAATTRIPGPSSAPSDGDVSEPAISVSTP